MAVLSSEGGLRVTNPPRGILRVTKLLGRFRIWMDSLEQPRWHLENIRTGIKTNGGDLRGNVPWSVYAIPAS
jgi:hypothetical protein